ncbi:MAG TPA: L-ribulose-5-phosphate 4-epimerase AraD [Phycisphaerae bacterium]|nr:L-ribulose-5-phosphate 4-epimerase AraD [Phycisphaerae bacterium]
MAFEALREEVYRVNMALVEAGLVKLTWGNASGVDRDAGGGGVMAIKPSGVPYARLSPADIVVLSIDTGKILEGTGRPSSDTPTHLHLYREFPGLGGIVHTHSDYATSFAQAHASISCLGTTHADHFYGTIPCTRPMKKEEIVSDYELNTGKIIVECFRSYNLNADHVPGVLVASHAPFAWGITPAKALENAIVLEYVAKMQLQSMTLNPKVGAIAQPLLDKHFLRKHGPGAYYGQAKA